MKAVGRGCRVSGMPILGKFEPSMDAREIALSELTALRVLDQVNAWVLESHMPPTELHIRVEGWKEE